MDESGIADIRLDWHAPDQAYVAVLLRDGQPWHLTGALVGMGPTAGEAVAELTGIARHLVIHGENYLTTTPLALADREWLFKSLDPGERDTEMHAALMGIDEQAETHDERCCMAAGIAPGRGPDPDCPGRTTEHRHTAIDECGPLSQCARSGHVDALNHGPAAGEGQNDPG